MRKWIDKRILPISFILCGAVIIFMIILSSTIVKGLPKGSDVQAGASSYALIMSVVVVLFELISMAIFNIMVSHMNKSLPLRVFITFLALGALGIVLSYIKYYIYPDFTLQWAFILNTVLISVIEVVKSVVCFLFRDKDLA